MRVNAIPSGVSEMSARASGSQPRALCSPQRRGRSAVAQERECGKTALGSRVCVGTAGHALPFDARPRNGVGNAALATASERRRYRL